RLLVLGGTHHVGRAVAEMALARGDDVTTVNRGQTGTDVPGVQVRHADRTDQAQLRSALGNDSWDAVIDTWSLAPSVVSDSAALLAGRGGPLGLRFEPVRLHLADPSRRGRKCPGRQW